MFWGPFRLHQIFSNSVQYFIYAGFGIFSNLETGVLEILDDGFQKNDLETSIQTKIERPVPKKVLI